MRRGCKVKTDCEALKERCKDDAKNKEENIKECKVACCVSDSDTPCNNAITFAADIMIVVISVVCGLRLNMRT